MSHWSGAQIGERPDLSIVICSHNGGQLLAGALASLAAQTFSPARYEVIVVDDGSTDDVARAARAGARVVRLAPSRGLAAARNAGVSAADGEIVAFTDDDCEVSPRWAEAPLVAFEAGDVLAVGGRVIPESA